MNNYDKLSEEQAAIESIYSALEPLDHAAKMRVLSYCQQFCIDEHEKELASQPSMQISP